MGACRMIYSYFVADIPSLLLPPQTLLSLHQFEGQFEYETLLNF